jgi:cysteine desulfuration protein SufE
MNSLQKYLRNPDHRVLFEEYCDLPTAEERLSWLMERAPSHSEVPQEVCTPERKVPGCLSSLWLHSEERAGNVYFSARSDSAMVQGITSFICDLYSGRNAEEVEAMGDSLVNLLAIERLLSPTRRRAVMNTVGFILQRARASLTGALVA